MSQEQSLITEVRRLADAFFDGDLSPADMARLESLIDHDTACLHAYVERLDFHGELLERADPQSNEQAAVGVIRDFSEACARRETREHRRFVLLSVGAFTTVCAVCGWLLLGELLRPAPLGSIAHLTENASSSSRTLELGQVLRKGATVSVDEGVLTLELPHVTLDLLGPAELKLNELKQVQLHRGTLTARVHPGGEGFLVRTPDAEVTDLGTEFSVRYEPRAGTNVSVRRGRVRGSLLDTDGLPSRVLELTAHRAAKFDRPKGELMESQMEMAPFEQVDRTRGTIRSITGQLRTTTEPPRSLLSEVTTTPNHMLILPEQQRVVLEQDLEIQTDAGITRLPAGTVISSYLVHYDPTTSVSMAPRGAITFFESIAAVITDTENLKKTDALLGLPETVYETRRSRGLEADDDVRVSDDRQTVSFFFRMESPEYQDQARVLVVHHELFQDMKK